jgi:hypothetical protein
MLVIVELIVLLGATVGVLSNAEAAHPLTTISCPAMTSRGRPPRRSFSGSRSARWSR